MQLSPLDHFGAVELQAMRLDGDLVRFGPGHRDRYLPLDEPQTVRMRAAALVADVPAGLVVASGTAAWIYDGLGAGVRLQVIARRRRRPPSGAWHLDVRYGALHDDEVVGIAGLAVTTLPRTLIDLARDPAYSVARMGELWRSVPPNERLDLERRMRGSPRARRLAGDARRRLDEALDQEVTRCTS